MGRDIKVMVVGDAAYVIFPFFAETKNETRSKEIEFFIAFSFAFKLKKE
jgi:hypothetical protein